MKTLFIVLCFGLLCGCGKRVEPGEENRNNVNRASEIASSFTVINIDECQYLYSGYSGNIIHKGNCNNPIHEWNKRK